jgi:hypothetical protein
MHAAQTLASGAEYPYDNRAPVDPAHRAALGVLDELSGRGGIGNELEGVDQETRTGIVDALAEIIRVACSPAVPATGARPAFYVASRASNLDRPRMWAQVRARHGYHFTSTWVDIALAGTALDLTDLWTDIAAEIAACDCLVLYVAPEDFPLKGAFVEVGMALALGKAVRVVAPGVVLDPVDCKPLGSWAKHPLVEFASTVEAAMAEFCQR